ncbi:MAG: nicotinamide-nucleotide adenylyltransferase [Promethearchaeota archaeon]
MGDPALFIGRFQPFHNGHLHALKEVLAKEEKVFIVVGSAQASYMPSNPFTAAERIIMVQHVLNGLEIPCTRYLIIPVPDAHNYTLWVDHIRRYVPRFGIVYTGSKTGATLFSAQNIPVTKLTLYRKESYSGTEVRRRILEGEKWRSLVPKVVAELIDEFDGEKRLKSLSD